MFFLHAPVRIDGFELPAHVWLDESRLPPRGSSITWHYYYGEMTFWKRDLSQHQNVRIWLFETIHERRMYEYIKYFNDWLRSRFTFTITTTQVIWFGQAILDGDHAICARVLSFLLGCGLPTKSTAAL